MSITPVTEINGNVAVNCVLISVSDKKDLNKFVPNLIAINPKVVILSTGGTFSHIKKEMPSFENLIQVSDFTGQPETQGGLVKTLDFKIYLGLLTETYNDAHQADLERTGAKFIDMVICNLYPFSETIAKPDTTPELARGNIDIGGPCMLRAAAKNFLRVASVVDPADYGKIIGEMIYTKGKTTLKTRREMAEKAFNHTAVYDRAIADYLNATSVDDFEKCYEIKGG